MEIRGQAPTALQGKLIRVLSVQNYITGLTQVETQDTIKSSGSFDLNLQADFTQLITLKVDNVTAQLYVQPDYLYNITFPEIDSTMNRNPDVDLPVNIGIMVSDTNELNNLTFDFLEMYNKVFTTDDERYLNRASMFRRCDSLQERCNRKYAGINNTYFKNYVQYSIAGVNASLSRGEKYLMERYIRRAPIQYQHATYMAFFKSLFGGYLTRAASQRKGETLYNIVNVRGDYEALLNFVRYDKEITSDSLRELIILSELWDFYFRSEFQPEAVKQIIQDLNRSTKNQMHKKISADMLVYFNKLRTGSPAPAFTALSKDKQLLMFSSLKKRWVYLNFFSTKNVESLKELPKIAAMKKKFGDKIVFLSICLDDSLKTYQQFLKANPKYDWPIWYNYGKGIKVTAKEAYAVTGTEAYFLIDQFGNLAASPAPSPSKGIEYKLNVIFKIRKKETKTGLR